MALLNPLLAAYGFGRRPMKVGNRWIFPQGNEVMAPGTEQPGLYGDDGQQGLLGLMAPEEPYGVREFPDATAPLMYDAEAWQRATPFDGRSWIAPQESPGMDQQDAELTPDQPAPNPWESSPGIVADGGWQGMTPEALDATRPEGPNPWQGMPQEALDATRQGLPQSVSRVEGGGLMGGLRKLASHPGLLDFGLGMLQQSGWTKMPVALGQAVGTAGQYAVQRGEHRGERARQDEFRAEQLAQMRLGREAQMQRARAEADKAVYERQLNEEQRVLYGQLQERLAAGDMAGAKKIAQVMAFKQNPAGAYKEVFGEAKEGEFTQIASQAGLTPGTPEYETARQNWLRKQTGAKPADEGEFTEIAREAGLTPGTPEYVRARKDWLAKKTTTAKAAEVNIYPPKLTFEQEGKIRDDFKTEAKTFVTVRDAYERIRAPLEKALKTGQINAAETLSAATSFMKLLDPGSVVRESELGMALASTGVLDRLMNTFNTLQKGKVLTQQQVKDFMDAANDLYAVAEKNHIDLETQYRGTAEAYGLDPNRAVPDYKPKRPGERKTPDKDPWEK
jgi:hypothetical protein